jgi:flagellar L-ring protein precursor FlgH
MGVQALLGYEAQLGKILPRDYNNADLFGFGAKSNTDGDGDIGRSETIEITFAALVTQVLPNGSLAIMGRQEVRVNYELRELMLTGVVRQQDIEADNSISHERIAEMRVAYGGRGTLSDLQQPRWGTQVMDILLPF